MENLIKATKSLILSIQAHPDYTGEENEEWTDLVNIAQQAIESCQHTQGMAEVIKRVYEQSYNIETQSGEKLVIVELEDAIEILRSTPVIKAKALRKKGTGEWYHVNWGTERLEGGSKFPECFGLETDMADFVHDGITVPADAELVNITIIVEP